MSLSIDELKAKVLPLFKSQNPSFIRQGMLLVDTFLSEQPEILDIFKDESGKWDISWVGNSSIDMEVRVWLMGHRVHMGETITSLSSREYENVPLHIPSSIEYLTTLDYLNIRTNGIPELLVQIIEHNPLLKVVNIDLEQSYGQTFTDETMQDFQERLNRIFQNLPNTTNLMMRIGLKFKDASKAFTYDLSGLTSIDKIWIQHTPNSIIHRLPPAPLRNFIWYVRDANNEILDPNGFPPSLKMLSLFRIDHPIQPLLKNVDTMALTEVTIENCSDYASFLESSGPVMHYTIDDDGTLAWPCRADFKEHNPKILETRVNHLEACGDAHKVRQLDWIRATWTLPLLHKMPNLEKITVGRLDNYDDLLLLNDFTQLKELDLSSLELTHFPTSIQLPQSLERVDLSRHKFTQDSDVSGLKSLVDDVMLVDHRIENRSVHNQNKSEHRLNYLPYRGESPIHPILNTFRLEHLCDKVSQGELTVHQLCLKEFTCSSFDVDWGAFTDLEILDFRQLNLSEIPKSMSACPNLRVIYTKENDAVKHASLRQNLRETFQFFHCKQDDLPNLDDNTIQSLKSLSLRGCMLKALPDTLNSLYDIEFLDLSFNMLNNDALDTITSAPKLWGIDVSLTNIKAPENGFPMFPQLRVVYLSKNQYADPAWQKVLPNIEFRQKMRG